MTLKGQAKKDYQREYMRNRRSNNKPMLDPVPVRPAIETHDVPLVPKDSPQVMGQKPILSTEIRYRANGVPFHPVIGWE